MTLPPLNKREITRLGDRHLITPVRPLHIIKVILLKLYYPPP